MPNWCRNELEVLAGEETLTSFLEAVTKPPEDSLLHFQEQDAYILENLLPHPLKQADLGTEVYEGDELELKFSFLTAWSPPCAGVETISKLYPAATFILTWHESGRCFMGGATYRDGVVLHEVNIEGPEYPQFAGDFDGDEYQKHCDDVCDVRDRIENELWEAAR